MGILSARLWRVLLTIAILAPASTAAAQEVLVPENAIEGQYIVVLKDEELARTRQPVPAVAATLARERGGRLFRTYEHALRGFAVAMSEAQAKALAGHPLVRYVEQDSVMFAIYTQTGATWGLDRIDQRTLPLSTTYTYDVTASNVHAYVIDTGIRGTHADFGGRVSATGYTAINDGQGTNDCNGHGTHVSGTIGGGRWGVAKEITLHAVRVLGCNGSGSTSGVIAGVNWVTQNHAKPAVANMSLGGGASTALDDAVRNSIAAGVTYAIAAGNSNANACDSSPARVSQALTVGATTSADARASYSNFGTCLDLFAPGSSITSAWNTSDTATNTINGTSMATPHVAGAAALYLAVNPDATPGEVNGAVIANATSNVVTSAGNGSPNRLLYSLFGGAPVDSPPTAAFTFSCPPTGLTCSFDASGSFDDHPPLAGFSWNFGDGTAGSGVTTSHTFSSGGTFTVALLVTDSIGQTDSETRSVTVTAGGGGAPCTNCTAYTGSLAGTGASQYQPNGTYYFSVAGTHRGWLQGPAGTDFDLFLQRWNGFWWATVARSESVTSVEQIAFAGGAGYYRWVVYSYSGSGSYTFWLQRP
jgi:serine protease